MTSLLLRAVSYPREAGPHEKRKYRETSETKLDPKKPPKTDWRAFDALSEEEALMDAVGELRYAHPRRRSLSRTSGQRRRRFVPCSIRPKGMLATALLWPQPLAPAPF
jgi:hypothetical protein